MRATYNITNNRLKFYPETNTRLSPDGDKERRQLNFCWWPGQKCFSAIWSPSAEDWIIKQGAEIEEDDTPDDVESRVERFEKYAEGAEAASQDAINRAENATTARRASAAESRSKNENERARYWTNRIVGAISHAQRHDDPRTCANRVKGLIADLRKEERIKAEHEALNREWQKDGLTLHRAKTISNYENTSICFAKNIYPLSDYEGASSLWSGLDKGIINECQAAEIAIPYHLKKITRCNRWIEHINMRLEYERAYLDAVGGTELLKPKPRRAAAPAPDDGIKKGDRVRIPNMYHSAYYTGTVLSLGSKTVKVQIDPDPITGRTYNPTHEARRYVEKV